MKQPKLTVTISRTAQGDADYMQIMSADMTTINIVLIAGQIVLDDMRKGRGKGK